MTTLATRIDLDAEAVRVVMGIAGAQARGDVTDIRFLLAGFVSAAVEAGWEEREAWSSLAVAGIIWTGRLTHCHAHHEGVSVAAAVQELAAVVVGASGDG